MMLEGRRNLSGLIREPNHHGSCITGLLTMVSQGVIRPCVLASVALRKSAESNHAR